MRVFSWWEKAQALTPSRSIPGKGTDGLSTILPVGDTIANRAPAVKLLKAVGHQVIEAADGWDALRRLRPDRRTRDLRIVALTPHAMAGTPEDALTFADAVLRSAADKRR